MLLCLPLSCKYCCKVCLDLCFDDAGQPHITPVCFINHATKTNYFAEECNSIEWVVCSGLAYVQGLVTTTPPQRLYMDTDGDGGAYRGI